MDFTLRCNSAKCRAQLDEQAVVTTCSHIFCVRCSDNSGLSNAAGRNRVCPACGTSLANPDDAVAAQLNPSEDYKTSVLSGLSPAVIMECAGRGIAFYSYQATQEILYQEYLAKNLTEKYSYLSSQLDQMIHDANKEISNLRTKLSTLSIDNDGLRTAHNDLKSAYNDKMKAHARIQKQYDNLKKQTLQIDVQSAAADAVEETLQSSANRFINPSTHTNDLYRQPVSLNSRLAYHERGRHPSRSSGSSGRDNIADDRQFRFSQGWGSQDEGPNQSTPAQHRTRLPIPTPQPDRVANYRPSQDAATAFSAAARQPLKPMSTNLNTKSNSTQYGMSSGIKVGRSFGRSDARGITMPR